MGNSIRLLYNEKDLSVGLSLAEFSMTMSNFTNGNVEVVNEIVEDINTCLPFFNQFEGE